MTLLHDLIDSAAQQWPDRVAISTKRQALTYRELAIASASIAVWLYGLGVRRGQRLVIVGPSDVVLPVLIYAASRVGAAFSVLHEQTRGGPLAHVLDDSEPVLLIAAEDEALDVARERGMLAVSLQEVRQQMLTPSKCVLSSQRSQGEPFSVDPLCLIYTSGTTSRPKAVVSTHEQAIFAIRAIQAVLAYRAEDVVYCPLPLSFDYGMYQLFLGAVSGAHVRLGLLAEVGPALLRNMTEVGTTVLASTPAVAESLARLLRRNNVSVPPLRLLTNTGAAMPVEPLITLRAAIPSLRVQLMFGLTECKRATIMPPDADLDRPGACGLALPGTELFAVDEAGSRLPPGETGELVVRGPNVMAGYWRRPDLTAQRFYRQDGLFPQLRTGDYGWLDEDGYVYFAGRRDDIYKDRGFRVSAIEVEAAVRRLPGIESAAVLPPLDGKPAVLAVVGDLTAEDVTLLLREEIEEFKIPQRCVVLSALPLTNNGKIDLKILRAEMADV